MVLCNVIKILLQIILQGDLDKNQIYINILTQKTTIKIYLANKSVTK